VGLSGGSTGKGRGGVRLGEEKCIKEKLTWKSFTEEEDEGVLDAGCELVVDDFTEVI